MPRLAGFKPEDCDPETGFPPMYTQGVKLFEELIHAAATFLPRFQTSGFEDCFHVLGHCEPPENGGLLR